MQSQDELSALITHNLHHNKHHIDEYKNMQESARALGNERASKFLAGVIEQLEQIDLDLNEVLGSLE
jgi:hypothetical protein